MNFPTCAFVTVVLLGLSACGSGSPAGGSGVTPAPTALANEGVFSRPASGTSANLLVVLGAGGSLCADAAQNVIRKNERLVGLTFEATDGASAFESNVPTGPYSVIDNGTFNTPGANSRYVEFVVADYDASCNVSQLPGIAGNVTLNQVSGTTVQGDYTVQTNEGTFVGSFTAMVCDPTDSSGSPTPQCE